MADDQSADDPRHDEVRSHDLSIMFTKEEEEWTGCDGWGCGLVENHIINSNSFSIVGMGE